jgi:hypothetical protein
MYTITPSTNVGEYACFKVDRQNKECVFKRLCFNVLQNNDLSVSFDVFSS